MLHRSLLLVIVCTLVFAGLATLSAHVVRGLASPAGATAFVASPSTSIDQLLPIAWGPFDTGLRVACFSVANTSPPRPGHPDWPRITGMGLELPDVRSGFSLLAPLDGDWEIQEGVRAKLPGRGTVTLDFAIVARVNPTGRTPGRPHDPRGIPPGQAPSREVGTKFCVSGPFPDTLPVGETTIELLINGVVVAFHGVEGTRQGTDVGVWENAARVIPLYP